MKKITIIYLLSIIEPVYSEEFNLSFIEGARNKNIEQIFKSDSNIMSGDYNLKLNVNKEYWGEFNVKISDVDSKNNTMCFDLEKLKSLKKRINENHYQSSYNKKRNCYYIDNEEYTSVSIDYNSLTINITIPNLYIIKSKQSDKELPYELGEDYLRVLYNYNFSNNFENSYYTDNLRLTLKGAKGSWNINSIYNIGSNNKGGFYSLTLSKPILKEKALFSIGKSMTNSNVFDNYTYYGVDFKSYNVLDPRRKSRYISPVITGSLTKDSNIKLTQDGIILYNEYIPSGPYKIENLPLLKQSDVVLTITDLSGDITDTISYPISYLSDILKDNDYEFNIAFGQREIYDELANAFYSDYNKFALFSLDYSMGNYTTYSGLILADDYLNTGFGLGAYLKSLGSAIVKYNFSLYDNGIENLSGDSISLNYAASISKNLKLSFSSYRYNSKNYVEYSNLNTNSDKVHSIESSVKDKFTFNLNYNINNYSISTYVWNQSYWGEQERNSQIGINLSKTFKDISVNFNFSSDNVFEDSFDNYNAYLSIGIPFNIGEQKWFSRSAISTNNNNEQTFSQKLNSYSNSTSYGIDYTKTIVENSSTDSITASYGSDFHNLFDYSLSYNNYNNTSNNIYGSLSGNFIKTQNSGVITSNNTSSTLYILDTDDKKGISVNSNDTKNPTNYNLVSLSPYNENDITISVDSQEAISINNNNTIINPFYGSIFYDKLSYEDVSYYYLKITSLSGYNTTNTLLVDNKDNIISVVDANQILSFSINKKNRNYKSLYITDGIKKCRLSLDNLKENSNVVQSYECIFN